MWISGVSALWLGILTSVSPCPMATNIAALSYIGQDLGQRRRVFLASGLYALGRTISYVGLSAILVVSLISIPDVSFYLQKYMNRALGPILIVTGMFLLELLSIPFSGIGINQGLQTRLAGWGVIGALPLGMVFALALCPVSAAIFFGSLAPLALREESAITLPMLYGIGTAIPVVAFSLLFGFGAGFVAKAYQKMAVAENWARKVTGVLFVGIGIYYSLIYIFKMI